MKGHAVKLAGWLGLLLLGLLTLWAGRTLLGCAFVLYDDEGYVLISLRNFSADGGLYDRVYSQYGPFFYLFNDGLHRLLGFEWTHAAGRAITLFNWADTAVLCAALAWRCTRSWTATIFVLVDTFTYLWVMIREPLHPGSLLCLGAALAAFVGGEALRARRLMGFAVITAAIGAAMALVKINVGGFLVIAAAIWLLCALPGRLAYAGQWLAVAGAALLPLVLMAGALHRPWVPTFAVLASVSAATAALACVPAARETPVSWRHWAVFIATGLVVTASVSAGILLRGTSLQALLNGVLLDPLRHPNVYAVLVEWRPLAVPAALAMLCIVAAWRRAPHSPRLLRAIAWLRVAAAVGFQLTLLPALAPFQGVYGLCYGIGLAGLFAIPLDLAGPDKLPEGTHRIKGWLAVLLTLQALHAFPVAGSQISWGTFLWIPLMIIGLVESLLFLQAPPSAAANTGLRLARGTLLTGIAAWLACNLAFMARAESRAGEALRLPGAKEVRLPLEIHSALHILTTNARTHGDMLFSLPGSFSLNLWSELPTPTQRNVTHWFSILGEDDQQAIITAMKDAHSPVFLVQHNMLAALMDEGYRAQGILMDYLRSDFDRAFALEGYSFWVRKGRTIAPLNLGLLEHPSGPDPDERQLRLILPPFTKPCARVQLIDTASLSIVLTLGPAETVAESTPVSLDGHRIGGPAKALWPIPLESLQHLRLRFALVGGLPPPYRLLVRLLDENGDVITTARVIPVTAISPAGGGCLKPVDGYTP